MQCTPIRPHHKRQRRWRHQTISGARILVETDEPLSNWPSNSPVDSDQRRRPVELARQRPTYRGPRSTRRAHQPAPLRQPWADCSGDQRPQFGQWPEFGSASPRVRTDGVACAQLRAGPAHLHRVAPWRRQLDIDLAGFCCRPLDRHPQIGGKTGRSRPNAPFTAPYDQTPLEDHESAPFWWATRLTSVDANQSVGIPFPQ